MPRCSNIKKTVLMSRQGQSFCLYVVLSRGGVTEKNGVISVEGGIVAKSTLLANVGRLFTGVEHLLRKKQTLFHDVLSWCLVELLLKQSKKIALTDKEVICDLLNVGDRAEIFIRVLECLGDQRRERVTLLGMRLRK